MANELLFSCTMDRQLTLSVSSLELTLIRVMRAEGVLQLVQQALVELLHGASCRKAGKLPSYKPHNCAQACEHDWLPYQAAYHAERRSAAPGEGGRGGGSRGDTISKENAGI